MAKFRKIPGLDTSAQRTVAGLDIGVRRFTTGAFAHFAFLAQMRSLQDAIAPLNHPILGLQGHTHELQRRLNPLHDLGLSAAQVDSIASIRGVAELMRAQEWFHEIPRFGFANPLHGALEPQLARYISPTLQLAERFEKQGLDLAWRRHLLSSITPSVELFAAVAPEPVGLLAFRDEPALGASLSWLRGDDDVRPAVAALVPEGPRLPRITLDGTAVCAVCGDALIEKEKTLRWRGNRGRFDIRVFPFCVRCLRRALQDEDFLADLLEDFDGPTLRLSGGEGQGDGVARGQLHLVPWHDDELGDGGDPDV